MGFLMNFVSSFFYLARHFEPSFPTSPPLPLFSPVIDYRFFYYGCALYVYLETQRPMTPPRAVFLLLFFVGRFLI